MYCILVTGIPAAGKTTMAGRIAEHFGLPVISKDCIKEIMFDDIGFESRQEKVQLGVASMNIMYYIAEQLMKMNQPFILENNFENSSREGLFRVLEKYSYTAVTVTLTGDYEVIYRRFCERNDSSDRHRGHVVNDSYPEKEPGRAVSPMPYESYRDFIVNRGMDSFRANGPQVVVDVTDYARVDINDIMNRIEAAL